MAGRESRSSVCVKMCLQQRARHEAYSEPSKEAQSWMAAARQRVCAHLNNQKSRQVCKLTAAAERQNQLTAQLKAAEARNRVRQLRQHYQNLKAGDYLKIIVHFIMCKHLKVPSVIPYLCFPGQYQYDGCNIVG